MKCWRSAESVEEETEYQTCGHL